MDNNQSPLTRVGTIGVNPTDALGIELLPPKPLSPLAEVVVSSFEHDVPLNNERKVTVNPIVSRVAAWYERLRNAMEYREEEVILRASIERILRRKLLLGGNARTTAEPLVRELVWARYLKDASVSDSEVSQVEQAIELFLSLRFAILEKKRIPEAKVNEWTYHLMSSAIEKALNPNPQKETMSNFMFQVLKDDVTILEETEETKNAQVYIAVRRAFARDDVAFLRYHLFTQFFGQLTHENFQSVAEEFDKGYKEIIYQLTYPRKERIYAYIKKRSAAFLILEDVLTKYKEQLRSLLANQDELSSSIFQACEERYNGISSKVRRAIVRSVIFILLTKVMFAFLIEGTYERIIYGRVIWLSIIINTSIPPFLMIVVSLFIRTPGEDNSRRIIEFIKILLFNDNPRLGAPLVVKKRPDKPNFVFNLLWLLAFILSFGSIVYVLSRLHFNIVSQGIFIFFLAIVSFLSYRISLTAHLYSVGERQGLITPLVDFLFMPVVRVGRHLTQEISRINFIIFIFDFIIETPFKVLFTFLEQWFRFLRSKSEELE